MSNKKFQVWLPLIFSLVLILGMYFGFKLNDTTGPGEGFFKSSRKSSLQEIMDLIKMRYVDSVRIDSLQYGAINEMMDHLDPHSVFIPASHLTEVNEDIDGRFQGIGVEFNIFSDTVNVVYVIPGGPGEKAGLQIGDQIIKIENENLTGKTISNDLVKNKIRGPKNTIAKLTVLRNKTPRSVDVTRGIIPVSALDAAYLIDKKTGYIRLNKFSKTAYEEFMQALEPMTKKGIENLVLDLRGNGGGLLDEAVQIADEFLDGDKLVVYTKGLNAGQREYYCKRPGLFEKGKLVVLVDDFSASASEVLAGALQDYCRATIVGRRTFGKGLVQEQFQLSDGSAIRLTIAKYYTPKGRSIQRSYEKGKEKYMDELWERYENGEMLHPDTAKITNGKAYKTECGNLVYGGGGITPSVFVSIDTHALNKNISRLFANGRLNNFTYLYFINHVEDFKHFTSPQNFITNFKKRDELWSSLQDYVSGDSLSLEKIPAQDKDFLLKRMMAQLARFQWRTTGFFEVLNQSDPVVEKALLELKK